MQYPQGAQGQMQYPQDAQGQMQYPTGSQGHEMPPPYFASPPYSASPPAGHFAQPSAPAAGNFPQPGAPAAGNFPQPSAPVSGTGDIPIDAQRATAPPQSQMDTFEHYTEAIGGFVLPPEVQSVVANQSAREAATNVPGISEEIAREALIEYIGGKCCYSTTKAKDLRIVGLETSSIHTYTLKTMAEKREVSWKQKAYTGGPIDGPQFGVPPQPWDIPVIRPQDFKTDKKVISVPHTASVKPCDQCYALGHVRCELCHGQGHTRCLQCSNGRVNTNENGVMVMKPCPHCHGTLRNRCLPCVGHGHVCCKTCKGHKQLLYYLVLTVSWMNHKSEHVVQTCDIPVSIVTKCKGGMTAFQEKYERVAPVTHFPVNEINQASVRLIQEHNNLCVQKRIALQRHVITIIPATRVTYTHKNKTDSYYVYGTGNDVYAPTYESACTIL